MKGAIKERGVDGGDDNRASRVHLKKKQNSSCSEKDQIVSVLTCLQDTFSVEAQCYSY